MLRTLLFWICCISCASAQDFSKQSIAGTAAILIDWSTTRQLSRQYEKGYYETGAVITALYGPRPSTSQVDTYFIGRLLVHYYISDILPKKYLPTYYTITILDHSAAASRNLWLGIEAKF